MIWQRVFMHAFQPTTTLKYIILTGDQREGERTAGTFDARTHAGLRGAAVRGQVSNKPCTARMKIVEGRDGVWNTTYRITGVLRVKGASETR